MISGVRVLVQAEGALKRTRDLQGRFANPEKVIVGPVRELFHRAMKQQYSTRGRWGGKRWANLKPSTVRRKMYEGTYGKGVLRRTDRLFNALTGRDKQDFEVVVNGKHVSFVVKVPYAFRHQQGQPGRMAARELIPDPMPESFMVALRNRVKGYLVTGEM
jgi:hypothetical protein